MSTDIRVAPLEAAPASFRSGRGELDRWLEQYALAATRAGSARVYVADRGGELVGYLAVAAGSTEPERAGPRTRAGMPRHPIPVVVLARLAVSEASQGQGVGRRLVQYAALITDRVARLVAVRALVVDATDETAAGFYRRVGFAPASPGSPRLEMLIKDLTALLDEDTSAGSGLGAPESG